MLGRHADHFMLAQARERVQAISPNAGGRSFAPPDQELAGTATVTMRRGMGMPGPQRVISGGALPGMGAIAAPRRIPLPPRSGGGALPGMSGVYGIDRSGALPGMGGADPSGALPGMGAYVASPAYQGVGGADPSGALPGMGNLFGLLGDVTLSNTTLVLIALGVGGYCYMKSRKKAA